MGRRKSPPGPHPDAFYGLAGRIVRAIEPHTEASAAALLIQLLAGVGFLFGRSAFYLADGARHFPNLFVVLVGDSAKARKGTSWNRIRELLERLPGWKGDRVTTGLSSGEGLIEQVKGPLARRPLLVIQTEFGSVLQVMARSGNTLSPVLRDAWDGSDLRVMTKNHPAFATGEHIVIIAHTTAEELSLRLETTDQWNGFANRFLWCDVHRARLLPHGGKLDDAVVQLLVKELETVTKWVRALKGKQIQWSPDAARAWVRAYAKLASPLPGLLGAVTSRAEAHVVRLALVYALLDKSPEITVDHLRAAVALWNYCERSARNVFGASTGDPVADRIRDALRQSRDGLTRTEVSELFKRHQPSSVIDRALQLLRDLGECEPHRETGRGRPIERWRVVSQQ